MPQFVNDARAEYNIALDRVAGDEKDKATQQERHKDLDPRVSSRIIEQENACYAENLVILEKAKEKYEEALAFEEKHKKTIGRAKLPPGRPRKYFAKTKVEFSHSNDLSVFIESYCQKHSFSLADLVRHALEQLQKSEETKGDNNV